MDKVRSYPSVVSLLEALSRNGLGAPVFLMIGLLMIIVPLPALVLDVGFTFNIALSIVVLLAVIYAAKPMDFSVFPSILLVATLLRLALNVASTRVVLLKGHSGDDAAGQVIESFGNFVVGGNYAVGFVVFAILVIINFVVVTKGAGRVSEVSARFTLDALPGKQMAIDADLNAGIIEQGEAKRRREEVVAEADYYGSMDGASKFVRGDAIAGLLILSINIVGGLVIGVFQHDMAVGDAFERYTLLTIGDGLVAQIPSLVLSTAAALMVTRASVGGELSDEIVGQLLKGGRALAIAAVVLGLFGLIPGMPNVVFLALAAAAGYLAWRNVKSGAREETDRKRNDEAASRQRVEEEIGWKDVPVIDAVGMEVGYRLIPLVDKARDGRLLGKIKSVRRKLSKDLGFLMPPVHIRDNLELDPGAYRVSVNGVVSAEVIVYPDRELAINPGEVYGDVKGIVGVDPAFGLPALWIENIEREHAQACGYTVVDVPTVIATHLNQVYVSHAAELFGHEEAQELLDRLSNSAPRLVQDTIPNTVSLRIFVKVLQNLLLEGVPLRDMRRVVEALADSGTNTQDVALLTNAVRTGLKRHIVQEIFGIRNELPVLTLDGQLEQILLQGGQMGGDSGPIVEPGLAKRLQQSMAESVERREIDGEPAVLLVSDGLREMISKFARLSAPGLRVLSFGEIPDDRRIRIVSTVAV